MKWSFPTNTWGRSDEKRFAAEPVCIRDDILLCEDLESSKLSWGMSQSELTTYGGGVSSANAYGSSMSLEVLLKAGLRNTIYPAARITPQQGAVYLRWYAKWSDSYTWNENITKHIYIISWDDGGVPIWRVPLHMERASAVQPHVGQPVFQLYCLMTDYPDAQCSGGEKRFRQNIGTPVEIVPGRWYGFEIMVRPDTVGVSFSGELKLWIDGELTAHYTNVSLRKSTQTSPINGVWITSYYGGGGSVAPQDQSVWYDQIVAGKNYIGPMGCVAPMPPSNLSVR